MTKNLYGNISMALLKSAVVPQYIMTYSEPYYKKPGIKKLNLDLFFQR